MVITASADRRNPPFVFVSSKTHRSETKKDRSLARNLDVADLVLEVLELLLEGLVLLGHILVLGLPLVSLVLQGLHLALEVAGFYVSLAKPVIISMLLVKKGKE